MRYRAFVPSQQFVRLGRFACTLLVLMIPFLAFAEDSKLSEGERQQIIRDFLAERPFVHRALPRGKAGVRIEGDKITPSDAEVQRLVLQLGAIAKPGERVKITAVRFVHHGVVFELNGGPQKRKSLRDRISVGVNGVDPRATQPQAPEDSVFNDSTGSSVFLALKDDARLTSAQIKDLLEPVLDFKAMSVAEAYQKSLPPKLAEAVKNHHALVGMDKDMVLYALGRPPHRVRETKDGKDIEEWIYGAPPQDVEFIRFLGDKAISIEDMKVSGEKRERTEDEVGNLGGVLDASQRRKLPDGVSANEDRRAAPTLLRPGEKQENPNAESRDRNLNIPPDISAPTPGDSGPTPPNSRAPNGNGPN